MSDAASFFGTARLAASTNQQQHQPSNENFSFNFNASSSSLSLAPASSLFSAKKSSTDGALFGSSSAAATSTPFSIGEINQNNNNNNNNNFGYLFQNLQSALEAQQYLECSSIQPQRVLDYSVDLLDIPPTVSRPGFSVPVNSSVVNKNQRFMSIFEASAACNKVQ
jgi:hypothetical protein